MSTRCQEKLKKEGVGLLLCCKWRISSIRKQFGLHIPAFNACLWFLFRFSYGQFTLILDCCENAQNVLTIYTIEIFDNRFANI